MEGDKKGETERLCTIGKTTVLEKTIKAELWHEQTAAINKLLKSDFKSNMEKIRKARFDPLNKETNEIKNCRAQNGTLLKMKDYANEYSICRFEDYSGIEANAFLRGNKDVGNLKVLKMLRPQKKKKK